MNLYLQAKGNAVHLLKAGTKRRRTQAEIKKDEEIRLKKEDQEKHLKFQYEKLQAELLKVKAEARTNNAAGMVLNEMIKSGELDQAQDGSVSVSKSKYGKPKP